MRATAAKLYRGEQPASQYIPYKHHVTDNIISTENGEYLTIFRLQGRTHVCASDEEIIRWHADLNHLWKQIGDQHVAFWTHVHHKKVDVYQKAEYKSKFAKMLDDNYASKFESTPTMANDLYLTVVYSPVGDNTQKYLSRVEKQSIDDVIRLRNESIERLEDISSQILQGMDIYGIEQLGIYFRDEDGNLVQDDTDADDDDDVELEGDEEGDLLDADIAPAAARPQPRGKVHAFSYALEFLSFLVNGEWVNVPVCQGAIQNYLQYNRTVSSHFGDIIQIRSVDGVRHTAAIEVRDYEPTTEPGQFNRFLSAPFEFVLTQSFICMGQGQAKSFLTKAQAALLETRDLSTSQTTQLSGAADELVSGTFIMGWHHATVHVLGGTSRETMGYARQARNMLANCGVSASPVGLASEAAYYAMLPANRALIPRPAGITSLNFLSFSSFHNLHTGKARNNPWGDAVTMFQTTSRSPLFFNFHYTLPSEDSRGKRPAGHTLFLGKTGAGKTTLMNAILTWATKYDCRMFIFDRDRGMQPMVMALGGYYRVIRESEPSGFQPLQMEPTKTNIEFCKRLVRALAETSLQGKLQPQDRVYISQAVEAVMGEESLIEKAERNMTRVMEYLPSPYRDSEDSALTLVDLLRPWTREGEHGWLFDNDSDELNLDINDIVAFDISDFIVEKDEPAPDSRMPMLMYLLYRMRKCVDGKRPTLKVFDEFSTYLDDPVMDIEIKRGLKTDRKKQGVYVFATQEPNDALESRIGKTVCQQVVTKVMLENDGANYDDYVNGLKLTPEEFHQVATIPEQSRQFLVKQGPLSAMATLDLSGMEREISILSGEPDKAEMIEGIIAEIGSNDPAQWMPVYWGRLGL